MQRKYNCATQHDKPEEPSQEPSAVKQQIFAGNATRFYKIRLKAADNTKMPAYSEDRLAALKREYVLTAEQPSNLRFGYVRAA